MLMTKINVDEFMANLDPEERKIFEETVLNGKCYYCQEKTDHVNEVIMPHHYLENNHRAIYPICKTCEESPEIIGEIEGKLIQMHLKNVSQMSKEDMN